MTRSTATTTALAPAPDTSAPGTLAPSPGRGAGRTKSRLRVAPPAPVTVPRAPFVALILIVVVAGVLGILVLNTKINENAFRLAQLHSERSNLDQQEQQLDQQLADLESPNSLAAAACRQGMVPANTPAYLTLPNGETIGVPQPATAKQCETGMTLGTPGR